MPRGHLLYISGLQRDHGFSRLEDSEEREREEKEVGLGRERTIKTECDRQDEAVQHAVPVLQKSRWVWAEV